jgi:hypothetical protein
MNVFPVPGPEMIARFRATDERIASEYCSRAAAYSLNSEYNRHQPVQEIEFAILKYSILSGSDLPDSVTVFGLFY